MAFCYNKTLNFGKLGGNIRKKLLGGAIDTAVNAAFGKFDPADLLDTARKELGKTIEDWVNNNNPALTGYNGLVKLLGQHLTRSGVAAWLIGLGLLPEVAAGIIAAAVGAVAVAAMSALLDSLRDPSSYDQIPTKCFPPLHPDYMDPLVINIDGQGIKLTDVATSTAYFDFAGDGFRERTGWVAPGTGFVVLDKNGNGSIDNGSELFGGPGEDGLAALAKFDADGNGRIDKKDAIFLQLRIWVDADGDAVTDAGELKTLAELGIKSILPQDTRLWA